MNQLTFENFTGRLTDHHRAADRYRQIYSDNAIRRPGLRARTARLLRRTADIIDIHRPSRPGAQPA